MKGSGVPRLLRRTGVTLGFVVLSCVAGVLLGVGLTPEASNAAALSVSVPPFALPTDVVSSRQTSAVASAPPDKRQEVTAEARSAYFRAVADHFGVAAREVAILGDWDLAPDEVPVVLFLAGKAGVSPDAVVGLRRSGRPWMDVADRFGVAVNVFHLVLPDAVALGPLTRAYGEFRGRPARDWSQIRLTDPEIIALVNLRVLSEQVAQPPLRVLMGREETGSFVTAYLRLRGG